MASPGFRDSSMRCVAATTNRLRLKCSRRNGPVRFTSGRRFSRVRCGLESHERTTDHRREGGDRGLHADPRPADAVRDPLGLCGVLFLDLGCAVRKWFLVAVLLLLPSPGWAQASLLGDLQAERAKYSVSMTPAQVAEMLNAVAWKNRAAGWG